MENKRLINTIGSYKKNKEIEDKEALIKIKIIFEPQNMKFR